MIQIKEITKESGIYLLRNKINNKIYIGKAVNVKARMYAHISQAKIGVKNTAIINAIRKYGWNNFTVEILQLEPDKSKLLQIESQWIEKYNSTNKHIGYNIVKYGSDTTGIRCSEETRRKISAATKQWHMKNNNPFFGKHHTEDSKRKISESHKAIFLSKGIPRKIRLKKSENDLEKSRKSRIEKISIPVKQIDIISSNIIKIWLSIKSAGESFSCSKYVSSGIVHVCKKDGHGDTAYGYGWDYATKEEYAEFKQKNPHLYADGE